MKNLLWFIIVLLSTSCSVNKQRDQNLIMNEADVIIFILDSIRNPVNGRLIYVNSMGEEVVKGISKYGSPIRIVRNTQYTLQEDNHIAVRFSVTNSNIGNLKQIGIQLHNNSVALGCNSMASRRPLRGKVFDFRTRMHLNNVTVSSHGSNTSTIGVGSYEACFPCVSTTTCNEQIITYSINNIIVTINLVKSGTPETTIDVFINDEAIIQSN